MFDRKAFKSEARRQLKGNMKIPVIATVLLFVLAMLLNGDYVFSKVMGCIDRFRHPMLYSNGLGASVPTSGFFHASRILHVLKLFAVGTFSIAYTYIFVRLHNNLAELEFNDFLDGISLWLKGFLGIVWYSLWVFIWSCLFVIPGIVKAFSYSQMFFILAENPEMSVFKAMKVSKVMTRGFKSDIFFMMLSFIGWWLLSCFTLGIVGLWTTPYCTMSMTNAYYYMKETALKSGTLTVADFVD